MAMKSSTKTLLWLAAGVGVVYLVKKSADANAAPLVSSLPAGTSPVTPSGAVAPATGVAAGTASTSLSTVEGAGAGTSIIDNNSGVDSGPITSPSQIADYIGTGGYSSRRRRWR